MLDVAVVTIFPEMLRALTEFGIPARAIAKQRLRLTAINPRDYTRDRHRTVDDRPYGGGPGMVMMAEPLARALDDAKERLGAAAPVIYLSPQGERLEQGTVRELARLDSMVLLAGRYEGVDERLLQSRVDREISIGDYVLSGGEFAAMVLIEAVARLLPGVLGNEASAEQDSFEQGLLDCPHYTRPEVFEGAATPAVLLSGDHGRIRAWRRGQALERTRERRPDLLQGNDLQPEEFE